MIYATPKDDLCKVFASADATRQDVTLASGEYDLSEPIITNAGIRGERGVAIRWRGGETKHEEDSDPPCMFTLRGEGRGWGPPCVRGRLFIDCRQMIGGLRIIEATDGIVENVRIQNAKRIGFQALRCWTTRMDLVRVSGSEGVAIDVDGLNGAHMNNATVYECVNNAGPLVKVQGTAAKVSFSIEKSTASTAIVDMTGRLLTVNFAYTEKSRAPVLFKVHDAEVPTLRNISTSQLGKDCADVDVMFENCIEPSIDGYIHYQSNVAGVHFNNCTAPRWSRIIDRHVLKGVAHVGVKPLNGLVYHTT